MELEIFPKSDMFTVNKYEEHDFVHRKSSPIFHQDAEDSVRKCSKAFATFHMTTIIVTVKSFNRLIECDCEMRSTLHY